MATLTASAMSSIPQVPVTPAIQAREIGELYDIHNNDEIGKGAFSRVVTGTSRMPTTANGAAPIKRAIKIMQMSSLNDRKVMTMMAHEKEILRRTRHPSILQLYETITTQDKVYMVMELMKGDLFEFTVGRRRKLNEVQAAQVMRQLLSAVAYLHNINVVHRDIKLENILVNDWNDIRLADFGLAKIIREPPGSAIKNTPCGTGFYIAPEVISAIDSGYGGITALVTTHDKLKMLDLWSCGVTLFVLLSGRPPFAGQVKTADERKDLLAKIDRGVLFPDQHWSHISAEAKDLISRLLARDSNVRITADSAQTHPWFELQKRKLDEYYAHKAAVQQQEQAAAIAASAAAGGGSNTSGGSGAASAPAAASPAGPIIVTPAHVKAGQALAQHEQASKAAQQQQQTAAAAVAVVVGAAAETLEGSPALAPKRTNTAEAEAAEAELRKQIDALQGGLRDDAEEGGAGDARADVGVVAGEVPAVRGGMAGGPPARRGGRGRGAGGPSAAGGAQ